MPRGKIDLSTPAPAPVVPRSVKMHDGFYTRVSVGFGHLGASFDDNDPSGDDLHGGGLSLGLDLSVGGSPSPGLALGGALFTQGAFSAKFERDSTNSEDRSLTVTLIGPFVDGFPVPSKGWHVGGMVGLSVVSIEGGTADEGTDTAGLGGAAWFGYDIWVADQWSIGPSLRLSGDVSRGDDDVHSSSFSSLLTLSVLYH